MPENIVPFVTQFVNGLTYKVDLYFGVAESEDEAYVKIRKSVFDHLYTFKDAIETHAIDTFEKFDYYYMNELYRCKIENPVITHLVCVDGKWKKLHLDYPRIFEEIVEMKSG